MFWEPVLSLESVEREKKGGRGCRVDGESEKG